MTAPLPRAAALPGPGRMRRRAANDGHFAATAGFHRLGYRACVEGAFAVFGSLRIVMYLPMLWAIHLGAGSDQHSLLTWLGWLGANATMALWLYEHNARRGNRAVAVSVGNAVMCAAAVALIALHRWG